MIENIQIYKQVKEVIRFFGFNTPEQLEDYLAENPKALEIYKKELKDILPKKEVKQAEQQEPKTEVK